MVARPDPEWCAACGGDYLTFSDVPRRAYSHGGPAGHRRGFAKAVRWPGLTQLRGDEVPVFWACGATAQVALEQARLPIAIAHSRAHMVVTDRTSHQFQLGIE